MYAQKQGNNNLQEEALFEPLSDSVLPNLTDSRPATLSSELHVYSAIEKMDLIENGIVTLLKHGTLFREKLYEHYREHLIQTGAAVDHASLQNSPFLKLVNQHDFLSHDLNILRIYLYQCKRNLSQQQDVPEETANKLVSTLLSAQSKMPGVVAIQTQFATLESALNFLGLPWKSLANSLEHYRQYDEATSEPNIRSFFSAAVIDLFAGYSSFLKQFEQSFCAISLDELASIR